MAANQRDDYEDAGMCRHGAEYMRMRDRIMSRKLEALNMMHFAAGLLAVASLNGGIALFHCAWFRNDASEDGDQWRTLFKRCHRYKGCVSVDVYHSEEWIAYTEVTMTFAFVLDVCACVLLTVAITLALPPVLGRFWSWPYCACAVLSLVSLLCKVFGLAVCTVYRNRYSFSDGEAGHLAEGYWCGGLSAIFSLTASICLLHIHRYVYDFIVAIQIGHMDQDQTPNQEEQEFDVGD